MSKPAMPTESVAEELKSGVVTIEGKTTEETPEEEAAMTIAFVCAIGNEKAREIVNTIKSGNVPHIKFESPIRCAFDGCDEPAEEGDKYCEGCGMIGRKERVIPAIPANQD